MLWECNECGAITVVRSRVCAECGTATRYTLVEEDDVPGNEPGSLRDYWLSKGAFGLARPPLRHRDDRQSARPL